MARAKSPEKKAVNEVDKTMSRMREAFLNDPLDDWIYALELLREEAQTYLECAEIDKRNEGE